jgi:hypothetical protein
MPECSGNLKLCAKTFGAYANSVVAADVKEALFKFGIHLRNGAKSWRKFMMIRRGLCL